MPQIWSTISLKKEKKMRFQRWLRLVAVKHIAAKVSARWVGAPVPSPSMQPFPAVASYQLTVAVAFSMGSAAVQTAM